MNPLETQLLAATGALLVFLVVVSLFGRAHYNRQGRRSGRDMAQDLYGEGTEERFDVLALDQLDNAEGRPGTPGPHHPETTYQPSGIFPQSKENT